MRSRTLALCAGALSTVLLLSACGGGSPGNTPDRATIPRQANEPPPPPNTGRAVQGISYDVTLSSNIDNADIAITIHEPETLVGGQVYPLILHSHGYSGSRQADRPALDSFIGQFLAAGYGVVSLDERGNGESGGEVRILDPAFEGQDWLQVLDWTEENLVWLEYDAAATPDTGFGKGNPVMGAIGGSYGGGYQHMIYAIDAKDRLDAIAPDITWNDLRYSLFSGQTFKSLWGNLLAGLGTRPPNRQHSDIAQGLAEGNGTNTLSAFSQNLLYGNSLESHCRGENTFTRPGGLRRIDAFYTQSHLDTLFNFNDAYHNYDCVGALGGDVRFYTKFSGHGLDNGDGSDVCGPIARKDATLAWYNEKLKGQVGAADFIPGICLNLGDSGTDAIVVNTITVGGSETANFSQNNFVAGEAVVGVPTIVEPALYTAPPGGNVLAGIPTIDLTIASALAAPAVDPIVFVGIGVRRNGANPQRPLMNQITPFRGEQAHNGRELVGVLERLQEGDELVLMLLPNSNANVASVSPDSIAGVFAGTAPPPPGAGDAGQYPTNASSTPNALNISGTINLPLIGAVHPAPTAP